MRRFSRFEIGVVIYMLIAVITFGHSAAHFDPSRLPDYQRALAQERTVIGGMMGALLWPLYWSWELQVPTKGGAA